jgi:hypothetical protein
MRKLVRKIAVSGRTGQGSLPDKNAQKNGPSPTRGRVLLMRKVVRKTVLSGRAGQGRFSGQQRG